MLISKCAKAMVAVSMMIGKTVAKAVKVVYTTVKTTIKNNKENVEETEEIKEEEVELNAAEESAIKTLGIAIAIFTFWTMMHMPIVTFVLTMAAIVDIASIIVTISNNFNIA